MNNKRHMQTGNEIGEEGAIALAEMLRFNTTLQEIDLASNKVTEDGQWMFAQVLSNSNHTLTALHLLCNAKTETNILDVIDTALASNKDEACLPFVCPIFHSHFNHRKNQANDRL